jgi:hypothetical protein
MCACMHAGLCLAAAECFLSIEAADTHGLQSASLCHAAAWHASTL